VAQDWVYMTIVAIPQQTMPIRIFSSDTHPPYESGRERAVLATRQ
jgi:hypothetical protein